MVGCRSLSREVNVALVLARIDLTSCQGLASGFERRRRSGDIVLNSSTSSVRIVLRARFPRSTMADRGGIVVIAIEATQWFAGLSLQHHAACAAPRGFPFATHATTSHGAPYSFLQSDLRCTRLDFCRSTITSSRSLRLPPVSRPLPPSTLPLPSSSGPVIFPVSQSVPCCVSHWEWNAVLVCQLEVSSLGRKVSSAWGSRATDRGRCLSVGKECKQQHFSLRHPPLATAPSLPQLRLQTLKTRASWPTTPTAARATTAGPPSTM